MIKTLAELEAENSDGFCNPVLSDFQWNKVREDTKKKRDYEAINTPTESCEEQEEDENTE
jgi:hypothetical protein